MSLSIRQVVNTIDGILSEIRSDVEEDLEVKDIAQLDVLNYNTISSLYRRVLEILRSGQIDFRMISLMNNLYELRWLTVEIVNNDDLNKLNEAYQFLMNHMSSSTVINQFWHVKFDENTPSEEYPQLLNQLEGILSDHKISIDSLYQGLIDKLPDIINDLKELEIS